MRPSHRDIAWSGAAVITLAAIGAVGWLAFSSWIAGLYALSGGASVGGVLCVALDLRALLIRQRRYRARLAELSAPGTSKPRPIAPPARPQRLSEVGLLRLEVARLQSQMADFLAQLSAGEAARQSALAELAKLGRDVDTANKSTIELIGLATGIDQQPAVAVLGAALVTFGIVAGTAASLLWLGTSHVSV